MNAIAVGALSGVLLSMTTSYLISARWFHAYQARTPATWRAESWRQHALAVLLQAAAGAALGWLFSIAGHPGGAAALPLIAAAWMAIAACILIQALYVNWHPAFVVGLLLDWAVFVAGIVLACQRWGDSG